MAAYLQSIGGGASTAVPESYTKHLVMLQKTVNITQEMFRDCRPTTGVAEDWGHTAGHGQGRDRKYITGQF